MTPPLAASPAAARRIIERFQFAVRLGRVADRAQVFDRLDAVAEHLDGIEGAVVVSDWREAGRLWLVVALDEPMRERDTAAFVADSPHHVRGTFAAVDHERRQR